jgi:glycosyltransferase involved in cell wall biosynthesis
MSEHTEERMAEGGRPAGVPLVLHVIPTRLARGAQREARALADQLDAPGVRHHRVLSLFDGPSEVATDFSLDHPGGTTPGVGFDPRLAIRLRSTLATFDPAVVVAHGSEPLKYLVPAMLGRRRPLVYYAIGTYSGSDRRLQLRMWGHLAARADLVAAEGDEVLEECVGRFGLPPERVVLAPNGRDPDKFHPRGGGGEPDRPLVIFVGALNSGKRPDRFVEVIARLRADGASLRAGVIGDGPLRDAVAGPAAAADVELLGARTDVALQMQRADILVFPSRPAGEGMPGVLIEAGLSGLPVVATAVPGVHAIVKDGETGFIVGVDDRSAMVAATASLVDDPELRSRMGRAAREHCLEHFSTDAVGARWMAILQPLLAKIPSSPGPA